MLLVLDPHPPPTLSHNRPFPITPPFLYCICSSQLLENVKFNRFTSFNEIQRKSDRRNTPYNLYNSRKFWCIQFYTYILQYCLKRTRCKICCGNLRVSNRRLKNEINQSVTFPIQTVNPKVFHYNLP